LITACSSSDPATLASAYREGFTIGVSISNRFSENPDPAELDLATTQFSSWTAENCLKPGPIQPAEGRFEFGLADRFVDLAEKQGKQIVGHTLVWHEQCPAWFFLGPDGQPAPAPLVEERMKTHIRTLVGRYKGRIAEWDVVNEALSDKPDEYLRPTKWHAALGEGFIATAFRTAHETDPSALLIYNDYNIEQPYKRTKALRLLRSLKEQGVPVHAVGIQGHWGVDQIPLEEIEKAIVEFSALGLKVLITELDLSVLPSKYWGADVSIQQAREEGLDPYTDGLPPEIAERQAEQYAALFRILWKHRVHIGRVTFWNLHDGVSWKNNFPIKGRTDYPLLFDRALHPKPAFHAVLPIPKS
jgi:endo-1,4-beta-xylanase